jgi:hypothetical protein
MQGGRGGHEDGKHQILTYEDTQTMLEGMAKFSDINTLPQAKKM